MHLLYKNLYILSALNTPFIEICTYSIKVIPEILNTYISLTLNTFHLRSYLKTLIQLVSSL